MVTGFEEDTTWGYDTALGYDEEQRRDERERYAAASGGWPAPFGQPPPGAPAPGTPAPIAPAPGPPSPSLIWRDALAAATAEPDPEPAATPAAAQAQAQAQARASAPARASAGGQRTHPARTVLGLAALAAERLRGGAPPSDALVTGVGLVQESATGARDFARRVLEPAARIAADAVDRAALIPGADRPLRTLSRSRDRLAQVVARARRRGEATVSAGRAEAEAFVRSSVAETLSWAQAQAVPQIVDGLVPHLVDQVVPRILEGTLPEIRTRVLPAVIDDLATSPQVRDLVLEQGRGVVGEAAVNLRTTTASADDRVESAVRRLVRAPSPDQPTDEPANHEPQNQGPQNHEPQNGGNAS